MLSSGQRFLKTQKTSSLKSKHQQQLRKVSQTSKHKKQACYHLNTVLQSRVLLHQEHKQPSVQQGLLVKEKETEQHQVGQNPHSGASNGLHLPLIRRDTVGARHDPYSPSPARADDTRQAGPGRDRPCPTRMETCPIRSWGFHVRKGRNGQGPAP